MSDWFAMDGYGAYVWSAYVVTALFLIWDLTAPARQRRRLRQRRPRRPTRKEMSS